MDEETNQYVKNKHCPPLPLEKEDEPLFTEYLKVTVQGLLQHPDSQWVQEIGWRQLTSDASNLAHEMVSQQKARFK